MIALPAPTAALSDRGRREANQDAVLSADLSGDRELLALADGMGGRAGGEVASATALRALEAGLRVGAELEDAVVAANAAVRAAAEDDPALSGMGTTLVALLRAGRSYHLCNVGDSRAYRVTRQAAVAVTRDHSFVAEAVASGHMTQEQAEKSPWRNVVTRSLGPEPIVQVDRFGPFAVAPIPHAMVLSSDGLHKFVPAEAIRDAVCDAATAEAAAEALLTLALDAGSDDNVSIVVRDFGLFAPHTDVATDAAAATRPTSRPAAPTPPMPISREGSPQPAPRQGAPLPVVGHPPQSRRGAGTLLYVPESRRSAGRGVLRTAHGRALVAIGLVPALLWAALQLFSF